MGIDDVFIDHVGMGINGYDSDDLMPGEFDGRRRMSKLFYDCIIQDQNG